MNKLSLSSILILSGLLIGDLSCKKASDSTAALVGENMTGTYSLNRIECFEPSNSTVVVNTADFTSPSNETLTISGNGIQQVSQDSNCTVTIGGSIKFYDDLTYEYTMNSIDATLGSCSLDYILDSLNLDNITPGTLTQIFTSGDLIQESGVYLSTPNQIALLKTPTAPEFAVTGASQRLCYKIFEAN